VRKHPGYTWEEYHEINQKLTAAEETIATLRRELEEARETLARYPERWYSEQTMAAVVKERDEANAKLAAVTLDNARLRGAAEKCLPVEGEEVSFVAHVTRLDNLRAALAACRKKLDLDPMDGTRETDKDGNRV
jgi:hypothetical protein